MVVPSTSTSVKVLADFISVKPRADELIVRKWTELVVDGAVAFGGDSWSFNTKSNSGLDRSMHSLRFDPPAMYPALT